MSSIISAFPGCGKSYLYSKLAGVFKIADSDSSNFSWVMDENGKPTKERNPNFPGNYLDHIKDLMSMNYDIIFISTHEEIRNILKDNDIPYTLVYPKLDAKETFLNYYKNRGSSEGFINLMSNNWNKFIESCSSDRDGKTCAHRMISCNMELEELVNVILKNKGLIK